MNEVKSIEQVRSVKKLPDGKYKGTWGAYRVTFGIGKKQYRMEMKDGIRTTAAPCIVTVKNGQVSVSLDW